MASQHNKGRNGRVGDIITYSMHGWNGAIIERIKAKTYEKKKAAMMIIRIMDNTGLNPDELEAYRKTITVEELDAQRIRINWNQPIDWSRDELGNII